MVIRRISKRLRDHSWFAVLVDLLVVVAGILIALQLGAWAEANEDRSLEEAYLERLAEDLEIERGRMEAAGRYAENRLAAVRLLARIAAEPSLAAAQPSRVPWAVETATWRSFPQINAYVYRELQSTGRLALVRSEALRRMLAEHYTALQHDARVGEDLSAQRRFDAATAGLLTIDELVAVERAGGDPEDWSTPPERAVEIADRLARLPAALAELPGIAQHHTFNLRVIDQMRARADALLTSLAAERREHDGR